MRGSLFFFFDRVQGEKQKEGNADPDYNTGGILKTCREKEARHHNNT